MHRSIVMISLLSVAVLGACFEEPDDSLLDEEESLAVQSAAAEIPPYCSGSGNPPRVREPVSGRTVQTKWCVARANVDGLNDGLLYSGNNWAVCQKYIGRDVDIPGWYVWTKGDRGQGAGNGWDWFRAYWFTSYRGDGPLPGLVNCSAYFR